MESKDDTKRVCNVCNEKKVTRILIYTINNYGCKEEADVCQECANEDKNGQPMLRHCWNCGQWATETHCQC